MESHTYSHESRNSQIWPFMNCLYFIYARSDGKNTRHWKVLRFFVSSVPTITLNYVNSFQTL